MTSQGELVILVVVLEQRVIKLNEDEVALRQYKTDPSTGNVESKSKDKCKGRGNSKSKKLKQKMKLGLELARFIISIVRIAIDVFILESFILHISFGMI